MSRSRRKTPVHGITTATSEKQDKARWHRAFRRAEHQRILHKPEQEPRHQREYCNPWLMSKDGKRYWHEMPDHMMRK